MTVRRRSDHDHESQRPLKSNESRPHRVPVVFLGIFQPEIVTIPSRIYQEQDLPIRADPTETAAQLGDAVDQRVYYKPNNYPRELTVRLLLDTTGIRENQITSPATWKIARTRRRLPYHPCSSSSLSTFYGGILGRDSPLTRGRTNPRQTNGSSLPVALACLPTTTSKPESRSRLLAPGRMPTLPMTRRSW